MITAVVDIETGEFCPFGAEPSDRFVRVALDRNPDPVRECWDGSVIVAKSKDAIAAALARQDAEAIPVPIRALLIHGLGKAATEDTIAAAFAEYLSILKGLV